jgi:hypothetical protein
MVEMRVGFALLGDAKGLGTKGVGDVEWCFCFVKGRTDWVTWSAESGRDWYDQECMSGMDVFGGRIEVWCIDGVMKW